MTSAADLYVIFTKTNIQQGAKMEQNEKIKFIKDLFEKNVHNVSSVKIKSEDQKEMFCLLVGNRSISVLIKNSFINKKTIEDIEKHFSKINIYHSIESDNTEKVIPKNDIVIWIDDPGCQELHRHQ